MNCRYCHNPLTESESVKTAAYWNATPDVCHASCKATGERQEAFDCQCIDADCNDCRSFLRGKLASKITSKLHTPNGRIVDVVHQPNVIYGYCQKLLTQTTAEPKKWSGLECFEHRRALKPNPSPESVSYTEQ